MDINLENWNTQNIIHTSNGLSEAVFNKTRTGKWEGVGGRTGGEKGGLRDFLGVGGLGKGKSFEM